VQTLVCPSAADQPRKVTSGLDPARVGMITAVLQRRFGVPLGKQDIYTATVGGVRLTEPAADLAVALALAGARVYVPVPADLVAIGEVGLAGEIRAVASMSRRLAEAERMGFRQAVVPDGTDVGSCAGRLTVTQAAHVGAAMLAALGPLS
jgi:DNA repair protein RadA/Sms